MKEAIAEAMAQIWLEINGTDNSHRFKSEEWSFVLAGVISRWVKQFKQQRGALLGAHPAGAG